jgi:hypothetical protein
MDLLRQAASDAGVLAIKMTLYRTGNNSPIVEALLAAALAGKDVTVIIELRARFDEEANIELSTRLQEAGAHVMYGVFGFKTHAKLVMVVRREDKGLRRYCHLGTGNYHPRTARLYTDYGLLTCDEEIGTDVHEIFLQLTSLTRTPRLRRLLQSPFYMHEALQGLIERELAHAVNGKPARIIVKLNALVDPQIISCLARRRAHRSDRARGLRPAPRYSRSVRQHRGALSDRSFSRALARLLVPKRRRQRAVSGERRLDGAQLFPPGRDRFSGAGREIARAHLQRSGDVSGR